MAKCALCGRRKGNRGCKMTGGMVCSLCCGQHRRKEACEGCAYYRDVVVSKPARDYSSVPRFSTETMSADLDLQSYANTIESALCLWDSLMGYRVEDSDALKVLKHLLDKFHFEEDTVETLGAPLRKGYEIVMSAIRNDLVDLPNEVLVKILSVIYFVARRRARGGRNYLELIHQFVGIRMGPNARVLHM